MILIDTSAFLAILSLRDQNHIIAKQIWDQFILKHESLITPNYLIVEALALIQNRLGMDAIRDFQEKMIPVVGIEWLTPQHHEEIMNSFLLVNRRQLSFIDCACFYTIRRLGIQKVFTFDAHFAEQGFEVIP